MSTTTSTTTPPKVQAPKQSISTFLNMPQTISALNGLISERRIEFVSSLIAICDADKKLAECDNAALMRCAMNAVTLNLPLNKNLGYAYVIPYKGVPQFQIGYKGLLQLAIRTGYYKCINAVEVRKDEIERNKITGEIKFVKENPQNEIVGYIAYLELQSGFRASFYMSNEEIEQHAVRFSQTYKYDKANNTMSSKWSDPLARPAMCKKTVLKLLLGTYGLMTTEFAKAFDADSEEPDAPNGNRYTEYTEIQQQDEPVQPDGDKNEEDNSQPKKIKL